MNESVWGPWHQDMTGLLTGHPDDVPAVVDQLTKLQDMLERIPPSVHGGSLTDFNRVYLRSTTSLLDELYEGRFADPAFLSRLDVEFAARYFDALRQWTGGSRCPRVWTVLLDRTTGARHDRVPCAAAGMNAHLNFDLPFALVTTFDHLGSDPVDDSDQHHDYLRINEIFAAASPELASGCLDRWRLLIDTMNGELDEWWQGETVTYSRNVSWRSAQRLWTLRHDLAATDRERARLDGNAAALGRLLVSPMGAFLH
ncbi:DUF5995 family protein [Mangrovihabitans endophyticus]|uniref:Uncharacterized protein n=1 Tax=Mangrovihabitans endophyticus TaxID=1751298 RepID=A0A8J3BZ20_9ACTN|nr:DUF5995 family protein [Mangrovihabitans endophyticus]GGK84515.1 hypothetical protein GCM10012284_18450 [Mangrovihabitans endophyticus]